MKFQDMVTLLDVLLDSGAETGRLPEEKAAIHAFARHVEREAARRAARAYECMRAYERVWRVRSGQADTAGMVAYRNGPDEPDDPGGTS